MNSRVALSIMNYNLSIEISIFNITRKLSCLKKNWIKSLEWTNSQMSAANTSMRDVIIVIWEVEF